MRVNSFHAWPYLIFNMIITDPSALSCLNVEVEALKNLTQPLPLLQVTTVTLEDLPGCSLSTLAQCPHLQALTLRRCGLKSLEGIKHLARLCYVDVQVNIQSVCELLLLLGFIFFLLKSFWCICLSRRKTTSLSWTVKTWPAYKFFCSAATSWRPSTV